MLTNNNQQHEISKWNKAISKPIILKLISRWHIIHGRLNGHHKQRQLILIFSIVKIKVRPLRLLYINHMVYHSPTSSEEAKDFIYVCVYVVCIYVYAYICIYIFLFLFSLPMMPVLIKSVALITFILNLIN